MPVPTPRQTRRARRLRDITGAARDLVVELGIEGFSVQKLAGRVDLTAGALYRYFESRDQMLVAVQVEVLSVFDRYLELVLQAAATSPILEQIIVALRAYVALAELQPQRFELNARFIGSMRPIFDAPAMEQTAGRTLAMLGRLSDLVARAQREGQLREGPAQHRAALAWSSVHGLVERRKLERLAPDAFAPEALMNELLLTLLVGWGASLKAAQNAVGKELSIDELRAAMTVAEAQDEVD